jgi:Fe-S cluster assembly iron-binding protein IscA
LDELLQDKITGEDMVFEFDGGAIRVAMNPKAGQPWTPLHLLYRLLVGSKQCTVAACIHDLHQPSPACCAATALQSLLYLFGLRLDFSDALIGGGFQFHNPNATDSCGCGKSFGV